MADQSQPNLYVLNAPGLHVTYSTGGLDGRPHLTYQDTRVILQFSGKEIQREETALGIQITVTTVHTVDTGSTAFTVVLPRIKLLRGQPAHVSTIGITTLHRVAIITHLHGQLDTYQVHSISGSASLVEF